MFILNPYTAKPNTIIGGVGSVITTKSALATKLKVSESMISAFKIVGSDIHCKMNNSYSIPTDCFSADVTITKYIDLDGSVNTVGVRAFINSSIKNISFPNATFLSNAFAYCSLLTNEDFDSELNYDKATIGQFTLRGCQISNYYFTNPSLNLSNSLLREATMVEVHYSGSSIGQDTFRSAKFDLIDAQNVSYIGATAFYPAQGPEIVSFPSLVTLDNAGQCFRQFTRVKHLYLDSLETITDNAKNVLFRACTSMELIRMKKLKVFGLPTSNNNVFTGIKMGVVIQVHEDLATSNSGNADAALVWAKTNRSAIVEFYDDSENYVSTL